MLASFEVLAKYIIDEKSIEVNYMVKKIEVN